MHPEIRLSFCVTEKFLILELFLFSISIEIYAITVKVRKEVRNWPNFIGHFEILIMKSDRHFRFDFGGLHSTREVLESESGLIFAI